MFKSDRSYLVVVEAVPMDAPLDSTGRRSKCCNLQMSPLLRIWKKSAHIQLNIGSITNGFVRYDITDPLVLIAHQTTMTCDTKDIFVWNVPSSREVVNNFSPTSDRHLRLNATIAYSLCFIMWKRKISFYV